MKLPSINEPGLAIEKRLRHPDRALWRASIEDALKRKSSWITSLHRQVKESARRRKIPFKLSFDDIVTLLLRCDGRCEVTGAELLDRKIDGAQMAWFRPSIDRISPQGVYEFSNCRVLCCAANIALGEWGEEIFGILAKGYCNKNGIRSIRSGSLRENLDFELRMAILRKLPDRVRET